MTTPPARRASEESCTSPFPLIAVSSPNPDRFKVLPSTVAIGHQEEGVHTLGCASVRECPPTRRARREVDRAGRLQGEAHNRVRHYGSGGDAKGER